ncbi:hypothetical protein Tco_1307021 [Tanacetum coccineum]
MPPIDDAKLAETMAKYYPDLVCKYYPDQPSYTPPPSSKPSTPPTIEESLAKLGDSIDKLELVMKRLVASAATQVSVITKATTVVSTITKTESSDHTTNTTYHVTHLTNIDITETTTEVNIGATYPITDIDNHEKTMAPVFVASSPVTKTDTKVVTKTPMIENNIATKTGSPISPLTSMHPYLAYKSPKLQQEISIFYPPTLHKSFDIVRFIEAKLATKQVVLSYSNRFSSLKPPKFVFLQPQPKPPWERCEPRAAQNLGLEDKAVFLDGSIDMCMKTKSKEQPLCPSITQHLRFIFK